MAEHDSENGFQDLRKTSGFEDWAPGKSKVKNGEVTTTFIESHGLKATRTTSSKKEPGVPVSY
jgi:hypothetical protein